VGAELFYEDRWADRHDEANICFHNYTNAPENVYWDKRSDKEANQN